MQDEEYRNFVHEKLLEILKFINGVCKKEGIEYSLIGGSLLGAVRHNGFIPWDDDADIVMKRAEFERFRKTMKTYLKDSPYAWSRDSRVEGVVFNNLSPIESVYGIKVDVFVLDNIPNNERLYKKHIFRLKKLQGMLKKEKLNWKKYSFKGKLLVLGTKLLGSFYKKENLLDKYEKESSRYNGISTDRMIVSNDLYELFHIPYDKKILSEICDHTFETEEFPIFRHYDEILTASYGDWMTFPPEEERVFLHTAIK